MWLPLSPPQVYRGPETKFCLRHLHSKTDYQVRVCGVRQCAPLDDSSSDTDSPRAPPPGVGEDLSGAFSPWVMFQTPSLKPVTPHPVTTVGAIAKIQERQLSDKQWASIILLCFAVCAIIIAFAAQQMVSYTNGGSSGTAVSSSGAVGSGEGASPSLTP